MRVIIEGLRAFVTWNINSDIFIAALLILCGRFYSIIIWWRCDISFLHILVIFEQWIYHLLWVFSMENRILLIQVVYLSWLYYLWFDGVIDCYLYLLMPWDHLLSGWIDLLWSLLVVLPFLHMLALTFFTWLVNVMYAYHRWYNLCRRGRSVSVNCLSPIVYWKIWTFLGIHMALFSTFNLFCRIG